LTILVQGVKDVGNRLSLAIITSIMFEPNMTYNTNKRAYSI